MDRQIDLLTWIFEYYEEEDLPLQLSSIYKEYRNETDYDKSKPNLSEILGKLEKRGLVESPSHGSYDLSDKGRKKADNVLNPDKFEGEKSEEYYDLVHELEMFFDDYKKEEVIKAQTEGRSFRVKVSDLQKYEFSVYEWLEEDPEKFCEALEEAAKESGDPTAELDYELVFDTSDFEKGIFKARDSQFTGSVLTIEGTVSYSTPPHGEIQSAVFECQQCGELEEKEQDSSQLKSPHKCPSCGSRGFETEERIIGNVIELSLTNTKEESQSIKAIFRLGDLDSSIRKSFRPGSKLKLTGILKDESRGKNSKKVDPYLEIISYEGLEKNVEGRISKQEKQEIKDKVKELDKNGSHPFDAFSKSLAPEIKGEEKDVIKRLVATSLIGASPLKDDGRLHVCIIGNPGCGKSNIVEITENKFNKFYMADGSNSSGVGLTASVEKEDNGNYRLKAGKLVYADKGVLAIDEFHDLDPDQTKPLKKAMQSGYFTLDKATQHAKLPGRASIVAVANYSEELDPESFNFVRDYIPDFEQAVKDRFGGLMYCLEPGSDRDKGQSAIREEFVNGGLSTETSLTDRELAVYHQVSKEYQPTVTDDAAELIDKWLDGNKSVADVKGNVSFKTSSMRYYVTLFKLTTMFARSRFSETAERRDAKRAVKLFMQCQRSRGLSEGETNKQKAEVNN